MVWTRGTPGLALDMPALSGLSHNYRLPLCPKFSDLFERPAFGLGYQPADQDDGQQRSRAEHPECAVRSPMLPHQWKCLIPGIADQPERGRRDRHGTPANLRRIDLGDDDP